jgi:glutamine amidotransferase
VIVLVDYGASNLRSVCSGFERAGAEVSVTTDAATVREAPLAVIAGVGNAESAARGLDAHGLADALRARVAAGRPVLGICLGMQLLFEESEEHGRHTGLGLLKGRVRRFGDALVVPHMGWNRLRLRRPHPLLDGIEEGAHVYYVHSYHCEAEADVTIAESDYGGAFPAAVASGRLLGVQFHPEKSQAVGLRMIANFVRLCGAGAGAAASLASGAGQA